ncbi:MAG: 2OG-Fe(II) oxygenase [Cyclobacteriaceae bacterium]|nr:2OG-Fe(II) oxygenase [Cyclobacteriaceae bacterium]MDH4297619.1 2OG-Fe(II) oxygenase [Cyclobacteriaceae bacterium]MDH5248143.1 2OG-Fe(II) oxygenase [Cyclobacteriaceae bacterium]
MKLINFESLQKGADTIRRDYDSKTPFHYTMFEGFFTPQAAELIYDEYPAIQDGKWDGTTYIDQKNKFQKTTFEPNSILENAMSELNSDPFLHWLEKISGIDNLKADMELFGGGLHQSIAGAFLNVHVDYNIHPKTKYHRRLNVLVYMNKDWKDEYEGHLELWDFSQGKKIQLAKYAPLFNRCVIFETNEISYHGHPKPLKTPSGVNRKSIATYYYTESRPLTEIAEAHNTIYVNTEGLAGQFKRLISGSKAFVERFIKR